MPATRSSSLQDSQQPSGQPYATRRSGASGSSKDVKKTSKPPSNEIIVLSSEDDEPSPKGTVPSKKSPSGRTLRKKGASAAAPLVTPGDVLEISSDDEGQSKKTSARKQTEAAVNDLRRTIKRLKEELKKSEKLVETTSQEVEELRDKCSNKDVFSGLGEHTSCEVCTLTLWCPYTLPQCGHSFCESCLIDWFNTTKAQHMTANPQLDNNRTALAGQIQAFMQLVPNLHAYGPQGHLHARAVLAELRRHRPEYTCPSCRKEVLNKPVEDFRLKGLVREIAGKMGETNPHKSTCLHRGTGPFDHFFAAPMST